MFGILIKLCNFDLSNTNNVFGTIRENKMAKAITIKDKVAAATELLKAMTTHTELRQWATANGMDNQSAFPKFKKALLEIGISYDGIKSGTHAVEAANLDASITHEVTLYTDAKASAQRFAICDRDGEVVWYGRFFDNDSDFNGEQSSGELAAAKKAVWLCSKIKEAIGVTAIRLNLIVDAQWLTYQDHSGQKGYALTIAARKFNIQLNVEWTKGTNNPADKWTVSDGYKKWSDNNLASLTAPIFADIAEAVIVNEAATVSAPKKENKVKILATFKDYDKSVGVRCSIYECMSEQSISRVMFFPKSMIEIVEGGIILPQWLFNKKKQELFEENASNSFKPSTFELELDVIAVD